MTADLKVLIVASILAFVASEHVFFKEGDEAFKTFLDELYKQIHVDSKTIGRVAAKVVLDMQQIVTKIGTLDPCYTFKLQRKGSSSEGLKVGYPDEFDFGLSNSEWTGKIVLEKNFAPDGFGYALQKHTTCLDKYRLRSTQYIDPAKVRGHLKDLVVEAMKKLNMDGKIRRPPFEGGPAVTFEFVTENQGYPEISIDMAIAIDQLKWPEDARTDVYEEVRKFVPAEIVPKVFPKPYTDLWQISVSQLEGEIMRNIDKDGGCRKKVLQLMKYFKTKSIGTWFSVVSYHLKNLLLQLNEEKNRKEDWEQDKLVPRFKDMVNLLLKSLREGYLPHFFLPGRNMLRKKPDLKSAIKSINDFLEKLYSDPRAFLPDKSKFAADQATYNDQPLQKPVYIFNI